MVRKRSFLLLSASLGFALALVFVRLQAPVVTAQESRQPFANSIEQRQQTVDELRKLQALMQKQIELTQKQIELTQKQIDLLTSGQVRVIVVEAKPEAGKRKGQ